jgi:RNA polymerase sigma-B factor
MAVPPPPPQRPVQSRPAPAVVAEQRLQRNRQWLDARADSSDPRQRLAWRNALVAENLDLVRSIAGREARGADLPFEDLVQVGCIGLIRALEAFDPSRGSRLSTFAVPYIRGAIQHEHRDRQTLVRIPRPLWELRQQASRLQEERRRLGAPELHGPALARALGCGDGPLAEALQLGRLAEMRSLDAPRPTGRDNGEESGPLLDQVADPASVAAPQEAVVAAPTEEHLWIRQRLQALLPLERALVLGRIDQNRTWVELGRELGLAPRQAQRRCLAVLTRLRQEADAWRQTHGTTASASTAASSV